MKHGLKSACNCSYLNYLLNLKNGVRKSALEQGGLSCYIIERERERERHLIGDTCTCHTPPSFPLIKPAMSFTPVLCFWCFPRNQHQSAQTMGRVRELEKDHVGFWTQKCCIKRIVGKSALEQGGLSCYIAERERERHLKGDTAIST